MGSVYTLAQNSFIFLQNGYALLGSHTYNSFDCYILVCSGWEYNIKDVLHFCFYLKTLVNWTLSKENKDRNVAIPFKTAICIDFIEVVKYFMFRSTDLLSFKYSLRFYRDNNQNYDFKTRVDISYLKVNLRQKSFIYSQIIMLFKLWSSVERFWNQASIILTTTTSIYTPCQDEKPAWMTHHVQGHKSTKATQLRYLLCYKIHVRTTNNYVLCKFN